jgi:transposase
MRTIGSAAELERRRLLAVRRVAEGYSQVGVAAFLGVNDRTVRRWVRQQRRFGDGGLAPVPHPGRCPKLLPSHEAIILSWLRDNPRRHGFHTELWTAPRIAQLIERHWGIHFHPRYLNEWLTRRGIRPQKPLLRPRERDQAAIDLWLAEDWPRLKKKRATSRPTSS